MSEERKRSGKVFCIVLTVVVVLVLYPLSWGPTIWLQASGNFPESLIWVDHVYDPIRWTLDELPDCVKQVWNIYLLCWASIADMPNIDPNWE